MIPHLAPELLSVYYLNTHTFICYIVHTKRWCTSYVNVCGQTQGTYCCSRSQHADGSQSRAMHGLMMTHVVGTLRPLFPCWCKPKAARYRTVYGCHAPRCCCAARLFRCGASLITQFLGHECEVERAAFNTPCGLHIVGWELPSQRYSYVTISMSCLNTTRRTHVSHVTCPCQIRLHYR